MVTISKPVPGVTVSAMTRFLRKARAAARLEGQVDLLVTGNATVRALNRRFRGKDKSTDVLSFPAAARNGLAGDIAISGEIAREQAQRLGHSTATEIKILILHGVLHLKGYDHETDHGEMARAERRLRRQLGLPDGLIERHHGPEGRRKKKVR